MHYRLYFLDLGDHIQRAIDLLCDSDEEAIEAVAHHRRAHILELWEKDHLVGRFEPKAA